jgi:hypothetical protein
MLHIPLLRKGQPYKSLDVVRVPHHRSGELFVEISQANAGLIRRDLLQQHRVKELLSSFSCAQLLGICSRAADHFMKDPLPIGEEMQSPQDYTRQVSATTGLPHVLVRRNMQKICGVLAQMESVLKGLTRNLDLEILDTGSGTVAGKEMSFFARSDSLGVVLPSNSPGVHTLWIPAVALKTPLILKPGSAEPWTPYRVIQALVQAGCPREVFDYYPTDHAGSGEILRNCGRGMVFGDAASTALWQGDSRIEIHGPGFSKIVIGEDCIDKWENYLDVMVASILDNGGRSCINASGIWAPARVEEIAEALADRLSKVVPRAAEDEEAQLAPFADANVAKRISEGIDRSLKEPGAFDVTASYRAGERLVTWQGCSYLLPTIVLCDSPAHPLANREFLFPFASVIPARPEEIPEVLGPSLVITAITSDPAFIRRLLVASNVDRLNVGPISTMQVSWDQPHEGNLFEHLYARRAFQKALAAV